MNEHAVPGKIVAFRIIVCAIVLVMIAEAVLRLFFLSPSRQLFDAELGWKYMPNSSIIHSAEGYAKHSLNELGLNDSALKDKVNIRKILILGDSYTEALEVERQDNFVSLIDMKFKNIDFINTGRGAYSPAHQLVVLDRMLVVFDVEHVILVLSHGDAADIINTPKHVLKNSSGDIVSMKPVSETRFALKDKFRSVLHHSALATYLMRRYASDLKVVLKYFKSPQEIFNEKKMPILKVDDEVINRHKSDLFKYVFSEIKSRAPLTVFYVPNIVYQASGVSEVSDYSKNEIDVITLASRESGADFHSMDKVFIDDYLQTGTPAFGFYNTRMGGEGHMNSYGHSIAAKYISRFVMGSSK